MKKPLRSAVKTSMPEDIAIDILMRLPVKPLQRLKCVSKSWYSLISNPYFIKLHLQYSNNHPKYVDPTSYFHRSYLYDLLSRESTGIALPFKNIKQHHPELCGATILCSCDGLLLLHCSYRKTEHIVVWNPLIRESRELPKVHIRHSTLPTTNYNIGYDSSTDDYNVIRTGYSLPDGGSVFSWERDLMVFSLKKSSSWRRIKDFNYDIILKDCINLNGALHWLRYPETSNSNDKKKVLCFSLANETIMEIELPHNNDAEIVLGQKLCIWQGFLCLSETLNLHPRLNLWLMKEYGTWTKFITISKLPLNDPLNTIPVPYYSMKKAIFIIKQEVDSMLVIYDLEKKELEINDRNRLKKYPHLELEFVESLVSPN